MCTVGLFFTRHVFFLQITDNPPENSLQLLLTATCNTSHCLSLY